MKKRNILMIAACPFPANYGSPAAIREMSDTLAELGNEVHIVTYAMGDEKLPLKYAHVHRIRSWGSSKDIKVGPTWQKPIDDLLLVFLACRVARKYKCELIHAHNYEGALVGILTKIWMGIPLLYNAVNLMSDELHTYNFLPQWLAKRLATFLDWFVPQIPDEILTISEELKTQMVGINIPASKITVIPIGVLPEIFDHADPAIFGPSLNPQGVPTVMYTGTIDAFQRVDYLLEAFARLDPGLENALLMIVCPLTHPAQKQVLMDLARKLKIDDRIVWVESHPLEDMPNYLAIADVAVVPRPNCAGYPVKLLNYMCASRPIVVAEGSAKGQRHMVNGYVCPDHDVADMARGISLLLQDKELAAGLGRAARQRLLDTFDWRVLCAEIEVIYERILSKRRKDPKRSSDSPRRPETVPADRAS